MHVNYLRLGVPRFVHHSTFANLSLVFVLTAIFRGRLDVLYGLDQRLLVHMVLNDVTQIQPHK